MRKKNVLVILVLLVTFFNQDVLAQHKRMKKKESDAQGTIFGYWGYNRSRYTKSDIRFVGPGYDFTMAGARAHDNPATGGVLDYIKPSSITIPQFNVRLGYYFRDHWAFSVGYDHLKYIFADGNEVFLSGEIDPGVDNVNNWSGIYDAEPITTSRSTFHYENSDGMNFLRVELTRTDRWLRFGPKEQFVISTSAGVSLGSILSYNDFNFAGSFSRRTISMSGMGIALHVAPRFEFFRHVFIQPQLSVGYLQQLKVKTRPNNASSYARHGFGYTELNAVLGFFAYIRPKNGCDSCPVW